MKRIFTIFMLLLAWAVTQAQELNIYLSGKTEVCNNVEETYYVRGADSVSYEWVARIENDTISSAKSDLDYFTVRWPESNAQGVLSVTVTDSNELTKKDSLLVDISSSLPLNEMDTIDALTNSDVTFLLIYPNKKSHEYKYQWYKDNEKMEGETQQYIYNENGLDKGIYKVYVSMFQDTTGALVCGTFSNEHAVDYSKPHVNKPDTHIYPNPSSHLNNVFFITSEIDTEYQVSVYALDGRLVFSETLYPGTNEITMSLASGIYIVRFTYGEEFLETKKIVIR